VAPPPARHRQPPGPAALALPTGVADGPPQGVQLIGDRYREDLCLQAGYVIEAALPVDTPIDTVSGLTACRPSR
jgi:Asp-tRNA(Asn)/Glu-tRNA(Gln) amidotransferase A subunit family amidase